MASNVGTLRGNAAPQQQTQKKDGKDAPATSGNGGTSGATSSASSTTTTRSDDYGVKRSSGTGGETIGAAPRAGASAVASKPPEKAAADYDFVVVGSGPGGAPLAARVASRSTAAETRRA